ncbi:MAG: HAD family hydrolase [bacterium]
MENCHPPRGLLLFDLDGTLIDSRADLAAAVNRTRADFGLAPRPVEDIAACVGEGLRNLVTRTMPELAEPQLDSAIAAGRRHYGAHLLDATTLYPGARETLARLCLAGYRLGILSNKPHEFTVEILARLGLASFFTVVMGSAVGRPMKPDPEPVLEALRQSGCQAAGSWVIGDHFTDLEAGRRAGVKRAFCTFGFGDARQEGNDLVIQALPELADYLLGAAASRWGSSQTVALGARH